MASRSRSKKSGQTKYVVTLTSFGDKALENLQEKERTKVLRWMSEVAPIEPGGKYLVNLRPQGIRSKRLGDIRILFRVAGKEVRVFQIAFRDDVYDDVQKLINKGALES